MARTKVIHTRTKQAADADVFCGMNKSSRFQLESVGPRAKGGNCQKCLRKQAAAKAG